MNTEKRERCGTPIALVDIDWGDGPVITRAWMERVGWSLAPGGEVWMQHTPESCAAARARAEARP